jgi:hypothetical protein
MPTARLTLVVCAVLVCLVPGRTALAQQGTTGSITGTVVDEQKQPVPGATVTLLNERTGDSRAVTANDRGKFAFFAVQAGAYTVRIELSGFRSIELKNNILNASSDISLGDVVLNVGAVTEVLTVEAQGTHVETENSDHSGLLTSKQISQIQTKGRDVMSLLRLVPGVRYEDDIEAMGDSFGSNVPQVGGARRAWNAVTVDGLLGNETSGTAKFSSALNLDAIEEVKVLLNTYKAEFGRSGGSNIQIVSKGGGSEYRGSLYYYGRRDAWNANTWLNNKNGVAKAKYHIDTPGFSFGGPVRIPGLVKQEEKKVFFFYSMEAPQVQKPGQLRKYLMPTAAERAGDFSQTLDTAGRLIVIRDPVTGQAFPGNVVPSNRIDPNASALLNMLPLPNRLDRNETKGAYNFVRQETATNPRLNNFGRIDWRKSDTSSMYFSARQFSSDQTGSEITAGPAKWGFFDGTYVFGDNSFTGAHTKIFSHNIVNELSGGFKWQTEGFGTGTDSDMDRIRRSKVGYNLGQLYPSLNSLGVIPQVQFGLAVSASSIDSPDFSYDSRLGNTAIDQVYTVRDTVTAVKGSHTFKFGGYFEFMQNREARGGNWMGQIQFNRNTSNPIDTNFAYSNALLGVFSQYTETDAYRKSFSRGIMAEWFAQDTWKPSSKLTIDYGVRFLFYTPWWRPDGLSANFVASQYDPAKAPRYYVPVMVNGTAMAQDPVSGALANQIYVGAFVPGTGVDGNGMTLGSQTKSFRDTLAPAPEPRVGMVYDPWGNGKTAFRASAGLFHQARLGGGLLGNIAGNPPYIHNPIVYYSTLSQLFAPGATQASRPQSVNAFEVHAETPAAFNMSVGIQREIGWGTVVDVSYVGTLGRHLEMEHNINAVPDGARFVDLHPENIDPRNGRALPDDFLRPFKGYGDIFVRDNWGTSSYNGLQVQANRRYIRGVQFGVAYTFSKAMSIGDDDPARVSLQRPLSWYYGVAAYNQTHNLVVSYTWDLPGLKGGNALTRAIVNGWQLSGENAFVSGEWAQVSMTTVDGFDFTGGEGGTGASLGGNGDTRLVRPVVIADMTLSNRDPVTGWFNTAAFARPARGVTGNEGRSPIERPGISNWNLSAFKNFSLGGSRTLQYRVEAYNVLNHTQFSDIDRNANFDAQGNQTNGNFGLASAVRQPRVIQMSLRFNF